MWRYDRSDSPPAPKMDVEVLAADTDTRGVPLRAKLDCGASTTVIPEQFVTLHNLAPHDITLVRAYDGSYRSCLVYRVGLKFNGFDLKWVRCIATVRDNILLGRNVMNRFVITLDGPNLAFDIRQ